MFNWDFQIKSTISSSQKTRYNSITNDQEQNEIAVFIREAIQNSVDATLKCANCLETGIKNKCPNCPSTVIKFSLITDPAPNDSIAMQTKRIKEAINNLPDKYKKDYEFKFNAFYNTDNGMEELNNKTPYLIIEDFNTTGLIGLIDKKLADPELAEKYAKHNTLLSFLSETGGNAKPNGRTSGGTWGLGKNAIIKRSVIDTFIVYSIRADENEIHTNPESELCNPKQIIGGRTNIPNFSVRENGGYKEYNGEANLGINSEGYTKPINDKKEINEWVENITHLNRNGDSGTSIFIPYPLNDEREDLSNFNNNNSPMEEISKVIKNDFFFLILDGKLECEFWLDGSHNQDLNLNQNELLNEYRRTTNTNYYKRSAEEHSLIFKYNLHIAYLISIGNNPGIPLPAGSQGVLRQNINVHFPKNALISRNNTALDEFINSALNDNREDLLKIWNESLGSGLFPQQKDIVVNLNFYSDDVLFGSIDLQLIEIPPTQQTERQIQSLERKHKEFIIRNYLPLPGEPSKILKSIPNGLGYIARFTPGQIVDMTRILATQENPTHSNFNITPNTTHADGTEEHQFVQTYSKYIFRKSYHLYQYTLQEFINTLLEIDIETDDDPYVQELFLAPADEHKPDENIPGDRDDDLPPPADDDDPDPPEPLINQSQGITYSIISKKRTRKYLQITRRLNNAKNPGKLNKITGWYGLKKGKANSKNNYMELDIWYDITQLEYTLIDNPAVAGYHESPLSSESIQHEINITISEEYQEKDFNIRIELPTEVQEPGDNEKYWAIGGEFELADSLNTTPENSDDNENLFNQ